MCQVYCSTRARWVKRCINIRVLQQGEQNVVSPTVDKRGVLTHICGRQPEGQHCSLLGELGVCGGGAANMEKVRSLGGFITPEIRKTRRGEEGMLMSRRSRSQRRQRRASHPVHVTSSRPFLSHSDLIQAEHQNIAVRSSTLRSTVTIPKA